MKERVRGVGGGGSHVDTVVLGSLLHLVAEVILADAAEVAGGAWHAQHPLSHPDGILCGTTWDVIHVRHRSQLLQDDFRE